MRYQRLVGIASIASLLFVACTQSSLDFGSTNQSLTGFVDEEESLEEECNVDTTELTNAAFAEYYRDISALLYEEESCGCDDDPYAACYSDSATPVAPEPVVLDPMLDTEAALLTEPAAFDPRVCTADPPPPKSITLKKYCELRPQIHAMIVRIKREKDNFKLTDNIFWVAEKFAGAFDIPLEYATEIVAMLLGKKDVIKSLDDLILYLEQWESGMGKAVCVPTHPENKDDPDKGARTVGGWAACKAIGAFDPRFVPGFCSTGSIPADKVAAVKDACDSQCRALGAVNENNGFTYTACITSCYSTMKQICFIAFNQADGKDAEIGCRWGKVGAYCDTLKPPQ